MTRGSWIILLIALFGLPAAANSETQTLSAATGCPLKSPHPLPLCSSEVLLAADRLEEPENKPGCPYPELTTESALAGDGGKLLRFIESDRRYQYALNGSTTFRFLLAHDGHAVRTLKLDPSYRNELFNHLSLKTLFDGPSGTAEGYSIREHTARVLTIFENQKEHFGLRQLTPKKGVRDWETLLRYTLVFHDIGKSVAFQTGDKSREEIFSTPLARALFRANGMTPEEISVATALIEQHHLIGRWLQGFVKENYVRHALDRAAATAGIKPTDLFRLLMAVYVADAGSYSFLCQGIFETTPEGRMVVPRTENINPAKRLCLHGR